MKFTNKIVLGLVMLLLCCPKLLLKKKSQIENIVEQIYKTTEEVHQSIVSDLENCKNVKHKFESFSDFKQLTQLESNQYILENFENNEIHRMYNKSSYLDLLHKYLNVVSLEEINTQTNLNKKELLIIAGEHPRELITVNLAAHIIKQFCFYKKFQ